MATLARFAGCCAVWLTAALLGGSLAHAAEDDAGFVAIVKGDWMLASKPDRLLVPGDPLPAGAVVKPAMGQTGDSVIKVILYDGTAKSYSEGFSVPGKKETFLGRRILDAVLGRYKTRVTEAASRGEEPLADAVVRLHEGTIDLSAVLSPLEAHTWTVRLTARKRTSDADKKLKPSAPLIVSLAWDGTTAPAIMAPGIEPGLYWAQLINATKKTAIGSPALVLVCDESRYADRQKQFAEASSAAENWESEDCADAAYLFRRALLEALAE